MICCVALARQPRGFTRVKLPRAIEHDPCGRACSPFVCVQLSSLEAPLSHNDQFALLANMTATIDSETLKQYLADSPPTVVPLTIAPHFEALSDKEKLYAHHLSVYATSTRSGCFSPNADIHGSACFAGTRVVLRQCSPESEPIYDFIIALHKHSKGDYSALAKDAGLSQGEIDEYLNYAAQFLGNLGNYKSFGDSKFIPRLESRQLKALATVSKDALASYNTFKDAIYAGDDVGKLHLGYPSAGHISTYYPDSPDITKEEIASVSDFLETKGLLPENTRIKKTSGGFEVLIASATDKPSPEQKDLKDDEWTFDGGKTVKLVFGDYTKEMATVAHHIDEAKKYAANPNQIQMMDEYSKSFSTGSLQAFKKSQMAWVQDKGPQVESDIGFIETYRDPHGIRGEWEGFVAMVNKERTKAFGKLVETAPQYIPLLPWSKDFEKDKFLSPDFTSLEVLTFAGSG